MSFLEERDKEGWTQPSNVRTDCTNILSVTSWPFYDAIMDEDPGHVSLLPGS
jgi:hypothetical protein